MSRDDWVRPHTKPVWCPCRRRVWRRPAFLLVLLLLLAGCNGPTSDVAGTDSPTVTPAPAPTLTETPVDSASVSSDDNATVVVSETPSPEVSSEVEWAIENEIHHVPLGKWHPLPDELGDTLYSATTAEPTG